MLTDRSRSLRWLLALSLCLLALIGMARAADGLVLTDGSDQPQEKIQAAAATLEQVRKSMDDPDAAEALQVLNDQTLKSKRDADAAVTALEPLLKQLDARIEQLGPEVEGAEESDDLQRQRKELGQERNDLDSSIKRGKLLSVEASQTADTIEKLRTQQFNAQITSKAASPLSPALWRQLASQLPLDLQRIGGLVRQGHTVFRSAIAESGWMVPLRGLLIGLLLMFPLRMWLRHSLPTQP